MEAKHEWTTWQELLAQLIKNPQEKRRLAYEAQVKPITLRRWVTGESQPREENIQRLARALPPHLSAAFLRLIGASFPAFARSDFTTRNIKPEIPSPLYAQLMQNYSLLPATLARSTLYEFILGHAVENLDPNKVGLSIGLICCVPPQHGQKIFALRQVAGIGTPPWERELERNVVFLGAESVAGASVISYHLSFIDSRDEVTIAPAHWTEYEQSAVAFPILRQARVAGALLASSCQPYYFTPVLKSLVEAYAHAAALIFDSSEFYSPSDVQLGIMPDASLQLPVIGGFEQRVSRKLTEAMVHNQHITIQQAHQYIWQEIADELLQLVGKNGLS
jgi:hypothetical protein